TVQRQRALVLCRSLLIRPQSRPSGFRSNGYLLLGVGLLLVGLVTLLPCGANELRRQVRGQGQDNGIRVARRGGGDLRGDVGRAARHRDRVGEREPTRLEDRIGQQRRQALPR